MLGLVSDTYCIFDRPKLKFEYAIVVLDKHHWMLYYLVSAMYPRFLITLNEELENLPVTVRVGQVSRLWSDRVSMVLIASTRPLTLSDKLENLARSLDSRRTKHQCVWARRSEGSWQRKSISHMHMSSKDSSSCKRIPGMRRRMQCNCSLGVHVLHNDTFHFYSLLVFSNVLYERRAHIPYLEMTGLQKFSAGSSLHRPDEHFRRLLALSMASALHAKSTRDSAEHY